MVVSFAATSKKYLQTYSDAAVDRAEHRSANNKPSSIISN